MHGNYDQCVDVSPQLKDVNREIKGRYCGAEIQVPPGMLPPIPAEVGALVISFVKLPSKNLKQTVRI